MRIARSHAMQRRSLRMTHEAMRSMPPSIVDDQAPCSAASMKPGEGLQCTVNFDAHRVVSDDEAALQFAGGVEEGQSGLIVVLSKCTIDTQSGDRFDHDAVVHVGGALARDLATRSGCLMRRAFALHGRLVMRSDGPGSYDLAAFSGTSPRSIAKA